MTNLDSILKSRNVTLPAKVCLVKAMVFLVVVYGCESWIIKKTECWRSDAFELWCWRRLLRVPWTAKRSNHSILKEISSEYSLNIHVLSAIRVVSSAYLRLLIFLPAILIPACASSSLAFCMMYSAYKLNKQGDNIQPWRTPFPIWNQSVVLRPVLTVASWPAYRFLQRQVSKALSKTLLETQMIRS